MMCDYCNNKLIADLRDNKNKRVCREHIKISMLKYKLSAYLIRLAKAINPCDIEIIVHFK